MKRCLVYLFIFIVTLLIAEPSTADNSYTFQADILMIAVPSDSGAYYEAELENTGDQRDTYVVTLISNIPDDWLSILCIDSLCVLDSGQVTLDPGQVSHVKPDIFPQMIPGDGEITINVLSLSNPDDTKQIIFRAVSGYPTLLVGNSTAEDQYRSYYENALNSSNIDFNYWDCNFSTFRYSDLINFQNLIIFTGDKLSDLFTEIELTSLTDFLNSNKNILLTGQGMASSLQGSDFLESTLNVGFVDTYNGDLTVNGVENDTISNGMDFPIEGGNGASNQTEPDIIELLNQSISIFTYSSGETSGSRYSNNNYKTVFLAYGLESIDNDDDRTTLISRVFDWFGQPTSVDDNNTTLPTDFSAYNYPNPFNASTNIVFTLPNRADIRIDIYDMLGRRVEVITDRVFEPGYHTIRWQNSDINSGVYFYKITTDNITETGKMMYLK